MITNDDDHTEWHLIPEDEFNQYFCADEVYGRNSSLAEYMQEELHLVELDAHYEPILAGVVETYYRKNGTGE